MQMLKDLEVCILISVCVHCLLAQTFPYVSFRGQTLANHSYVNFSLVENDASGSDSVQCHTDLIKCCNSTAGSHRGDWYFPNGTRLPFSTDSPKPAVGESRGNQRVDLRRKKQGTSGIYRCDTQFIITMISVYEIQCMLDSISMEVSSASNTNPPPNL